MVNIDISKSVTLSLPDQTGNVIEKEVTVAQVIKDTVTN